MPNKQKTINNRITISGIGLHTGIKCNMTFIPAEEDFGIKFQRVDLKNKPIIEADADLVDSTNRGTTLKKNNVSVYTTEHVLAAIEGAEIDNILIEIDAPEIPILDGSSIGFTNALKEVGCKTQDKDRNYFEVKRKITYIDEATGSEIQIKPHNKLKIEVEIDYDSRTLEKQNYTLKDINDFENEISSSRTMIS